MLATRILRASKMVVGIGIKDMEGSKLALRKAIKMAQPGDKIIALHIPKLVPEMLLSSMSDPSEASEDTMEAFAKDPAQTGAGITSQAKAAAEEEMKALGKEVEMSYKVVDPVQDVKVGLLRAAAVEKPDFLWVGPGVGGHGSIPAFAATRAKGLTVCVVRDGM
eukprot:CAMPEP_0170607968 /NCGR_PEP_ID=MMETSP0224-20130122/21337_1 /TAXON_ID=285029 /ORGANISM="Togula jolla, Strain CCCM 725" /LENGTH=163 /DNA_ID=CAMNT_0010933169 /DNA_START=74 /DNA_END=565 /DNA_ORIENTATION=+